MESSFQTHRDIGYITAFDNLNDDNATVFTPWQRGIFVHTNVSFILKNLRSQKSYLECALAHTLYRWVFPCQLRDRYESCDSGNFINGKTPFYSVTTQEQLGKCSLTVTKSTCRQSLSIKISS